MYISYCSTSYMVLNKYQVTNNLIAEVQFLLFLRFLLWQSPAGTLQDSFSISASLNVPVPQLQVQASQSCRTENYIIIYIVKVPVCRFGAKEVLIQHPSVQF